MQETLVRESVAPTKFAHLFSPGKTLASALSRLDIQPFTESSVIQYRKEKTKQAVEVIIAANHLTPLQRSTGPYEEIETASIRDYLAQHRTTDGYYGFYNHTKDIRVGLNDAPVLVATFGVPVCVFVAWHVNPILPTDQRIPTFARRKAEQIVAEVPDATFEIEELKDKTHSYDPFLVAVRGKERYYIEVWDERAFENQEHNVRMNAMPCVDPQPANRPFFGFPPLLRGRFGK
jgi:hypothetical protein